MQNLIKGYFLLLALPLLLAGCASSGKVQQQYSESWLDHAHKVERISHWTLDGKMGARQNDEATSFNIYWYQADERFNIRLSGPLGQGAVTINGLPGNVTMTSSQGTQKAASLHELMQRNSDIVLPLDQLQYWFRGIPDPHYRAGIRFNNDGLLAELRQNGWQVLYSDYHNDDLPMPRKFTLAKGDKSAKIVIKKWELEI